MKSRCTATFGLQSAVLAAVAVALVVGLPGCEEEPVVQVVRTAPPPPPPPPPAKPAVTSIADLMAQLSIDDRVVLPEEKAPDNDPDRIAVLTFFDAFARGDAESLGTMMSLLDRIELDALAATDAWKETIDALERIEVETGPSPYGQNCALAVFQISGDYQPQLWYYAATTSGSTFDAAPSPPRVIDKLFGDDWITRWHELLEEEIALANQLDAEIEEQQVNLDNSRSRGGSTGRSTQPRPAGPGLAPSGNPNGPHRRPPGKKRKPPGSR